MKKEKACINLQADVYQLQSLNTKGFGDSGRLITRETQLTTGHS